MSIVETLTLDPAAVAAPCAICGAVHGPRCQVERPRLRLEGRPDHERVEIEAWLGRAPERILVCLRHLYRHAAPAPAYRTDARVREASAMNLYILAFGHPCPSGYGRRPVRRTRLASPPAEVTPADIDRLHAERRRKARKNRRRQLRRLVAIVAKFSHRGLRRRER